MEEDPPYKLSVAELAGRFRGQTIASPTSNEESLHRRRLPCSLKLSSPRDEQDGESKKPVILLPRPFRVNTKSNSIIEKLQANLALSPNSLSPSPRTPEVKLQTVCTPSSPPPGPCSPGTPHSSPPPTHQSTQEEEEEEAAVCFEAPPEGTPLPSFNKTRARLSVKRRPPTRRHRQSFGEEGADGNSLSPWQPETAGPGAERDDGGEEEESGRMSLDPDAPLSQSECREEAGRAQTVGDKDSAENADRGEAGLATRGSLDPSEGICAAEGTEDVTTQNAPQHEERETA